ncbi:MAG: hypothetical protein WAO83_07970 [Fuerstiella sp.]
MFRNPVFYSDSVQFQAGLPLFLNLSVFGDHCSAARYSYYRQELCCDFWRNLLEPLKHMVPLWGER